MEIQHFMNKKKIMSFWFTLKKKELWTFFFPVDWIIRCKYTNNAFSPILQKIRFLPFDLSVFHVTVICRKWAKMAQIELWSKIRMIFQRNQVLTIYYHNLIMRRRKKAAKRKVSKKKKAKRKVTPKRKASKK